MYCVTICVTWASNCSMSALVKSLAACRLVSLPALAHHTRQQRAQSVCTNEGALYALAESRSRLTYSAGSSSNSSSSNVRSVMLGRTIFSQKASSVCWLSNRARCDGILTTVPRKAVALATSCRPQRDQPPVPCGTTRQKRDGCAPCRT